ncbi:MAG: ATP-binding cassette domain-containing protein [Planctomycetia bacterium]|nr:ATP-binding cassette domain-containing protein [Planctomycetia bacterium]
MALIDLREITVRFRGPPLLDHVDCQIERGQRIGLLGRNGSGKTTLMRLLCGQAVPDGGTLRMAAGTRVSLLPQDVPQQVSGNVADVVAEGLSRENPAADESWHEEPWRATQRVSEVLSRMELDPKAEFAQLSSGMKRRVLLAKAIVPDPDLLLLDEPTNHLDIDAIGWLEDFLSRFDATLIFVTHDRVFLRRLAQRIIELDRGKLFDWSCDYDTFLARKEAALAAEEKQDALFDKRLAEEERWIRQGVKARRTRNEGRVRALEDMRRQRAERRSPTADVKMKIQAAQRSGNLVAEIEKVSFAYLDRPIVTDFSTTIMRGDKVGIIGRNGSGKTTLLRILLGQLAPQSGTVRLGTNLQIAYFDQLREQLRDDATVQDNVGDGYDTIDIGGRKRHVIGYLQDFLFSPERARTPVRFLSGGERNRVLLAKLFAKPANVIVLDEPTNDLDSETLELLETLLVEFAGTVLLVSHDREFLNNVVSSTIVFEENGAEEYVGGYDDWLRVRAQRTAAASSATDTSAGKRRGGKASGGNAGNSSSAGDASAGRRRLTFKEQQELAACPAAIEQMEAEIETLHQAMADPDFFQKPGPQIAAERTRLNDLEKRLKTTYARWQELEQRSG